MDMAQRYCERSAMLLRLLDDSDLGLWVGEPAKAEIRRVLHQPEPGEVLPIAGLVTQSDQQMN